MHVVIMGSGGVGAYVGARLQQAGADVSFVARGAQLQAFQSKGLTLESALGDVQLPSVRATDTPGSLKRADVIVFAVKLYDMEEAAERVRPIVGSETVVVPLLNGVDAPETIDRILGEGTSAGGVIKISSTIVEPGLIRHMGNFAKLIIGARFDAQKVKLQALCDLLGSAGVDVTLSEAILTDLWKKMVFLAPLSALTALVRAPIGVVRDDEKLAELFRAAVTEAVRIGWAIGADLDADEVQQVWQFTQSLPADMPSSMQVDLAAGRRLELPWLSGALVRMGAELSIPTPTHELAATLLGPHVNGKL